MVNPMKRFSILLAALAVASSAPAAEADDVPVELLWHACPYLIGTAASVALKRLTLPPEDVQAVAEVACQVAQAYTDIAANPPDAPPGDSETAEEIFCEGSFLDACAGVEGAATRVALDAPVEGETTVLVPLADIDEAKLVLTDELIKESRRRQGPAGTGITDGADAESAPMRQLVCFTIGDETYGIDIRAVREIRAWSATTALPNAPHC